MNMVETFNRQQVEKQLTQGKLCDFKAGDTLKVWIKVVEGDRERLQAYEGVCIGRKNDGINSAFTVRKISFGEGVERIFPLYSPNIKVEVVRKGHVRRAKLYYLRERSGKSARITEDSSLNKAEALLEKVSPVPASEASSAISEE